jgi:hypothetical protein
VRALVLGAVARGVAREAGAQRAAISARWPVRGRCALMPSRSLCSVCSADICGVSCASARRSGRGCVRHAPWAVARFPPRARTEDRGHGWAPGRAGLVVGRLSRQRRWSSATHAGQRSRGARACARRGAREHDPRVGLGCGRLSRARGPGGPCARVRRRPRRRAAAAGPSGWAPPPPRPSARTVPEGRRSVAAVPARPCRSRGPRRAGRREHSRRRARRALRTVGAGARSHAGAQPRSAAGRGESPRRCERGGSMRLGFYARVKQRRGPPGWRPSKAGRASLAASRRPLRSRVTSPWR